MKALSIALTLAAFSLAGCHHSHSESKPTRAPIHLTLLGTNDLHGWIQPHPYHLPDGGTVGEGGVPVFAGYLANLRAKNPDGVLLLGAGDLFQGTLVSNLSEGKVVVDLYNRLGFTAVAVGNHEFDYGPVGKVSVVSGDLNPFGALEARIDQAHFPFLAANITEAKTGRHPAWFHNDGTMIVTVKGVKVGLLGLTTPSTPETTNPTNVTTLRFGALLPTTERAAKALRAKGAQVVVALAHAGGRCHSNANPRDLSTCNVKQGEIFRFLEALPSGTLDAVIAGHTHAALGKFVRGVPVIESPGLGRAFGVVDLYVDPATHHVLTARTRIHTDIGICRVADPRSHRCDGWFLKRHPKAKLLPATYLGRPVTVDASLTQLMAPALARVHAEQQKRLGVEVPEALGRDYVGESALGDLLADALRALDHADVALLNPGGLRADVPEGALTFGRVFEVIPFDNTVATVTVTGKQLLAVLAAAYDGHKGVFQESGLKVKLGRCPGEGRFEGAVLANGKPISPSAKYRVAMPDFLARGGDGLEKALKPLPPEQIDLGMRRPLGFRDALISYWKERAKPLEAPNLGRISYVGKQERCAP